MAKVGTGRYRQKIGGAGNAPSVSNEAPLPALRREGEVASPSALVTLPQPSKESIASALQGIRIGQSDSFFLLQRANPGLINNKDDTGATPLHWFALRGEEANVRRCLLLGAAVDERANNAQTPLMWAVINGHTRIAECLLGNGADVCARDTLGATPLILSLQHSHTLLFLRLLDYGADPRQADVKGCTVAHWAAYKGQLGILRAIRSLLGWSAMTAEDGDGYQPIHRAARGGSLECVQFFVEECGVDPRTRAGEAGNGGGSSVTRRHAGNSIGFGIGWCHPTTAKVDSKAKKSDKENEDSGSSSTGNDEQSGDSTSAGGEVELTSSASSSSTSTLAAGGGPSTFTSAGTGLLGRGGALGRSTLGSGGLPSALGNRRPAVVGGGPSAVGGVRTEELPPVTFGGGKDASAAASSKPSSSTSSAAVSTGTSAYGSSLAALPASAAAPVSSAGSPLDMAEDALRLMVSSFEAGGEYAGRQGLIKTQRELVKFLRTESEIYSHRDKSFIGKLAFAYHATQLPRVYGRVWVPGGFCGMLLFAFSYWALKINGTPRVVASSDGSGYSVDAEAGQSLSLFSIALITVLCALYLKIYFGSAGALDPYGSLGNDTWFSTSPFEVLRHPHADPRCYGSGDRFRPSGTSHLKKREAKLMERFKETRWHHYQRQLDQAAAQQAKSSSALVAGSTASVFGSAAASGLGADGSRPLMADGSRPLKADGSVDYDRLVEMQLEGTSASAPAASSPAPAPAAPPSSEVAAATVEPPSWKTSADDDCNDFHWEQEDQESNAISVGDGEQLGPIGRLFEDVRRQGATLRRVWGPWSSIGHPGGAAGMQFASPQLQKAFKAAADLTETVNARICVSCGILKPLRAKHDSTTDRCYNRYDHFCIWLGSPVTGVNFRLFMLFLVLLIASCLFGLCYGYSYAKFLAYSGDLHAATQAILDNLRQQKENTAAGTASPGSTAMETMSIGFFRVLRYLFVSSWQLCAYTVIVLVGMIFPSTLLYRHGVIAMQNVTLNEMKNMHRFAHFQTLKLQPTPPAPGSSSTDGGEDLAPVFENPFDLKDKQKNCLDILSPYTMDRVSFASVAERDRRYLDEGVRVMQGQMQTEIGRVREALKQEIEKVALENLTNSTGAAVGGLAGKDDTASAFGAPGGVFAGAGAPAGAALGGPSKEQLAAVAFLNSRMQEFPVLVGMAMAGQIDVQRPSLKKLLASLPEEVEPSVVQKRVMTMRATFIVRKAWEVMWAQTIAKQQGHHGHSHGGPGGGHGHGGGGSHGHSHGGEPCDGHGHGGGASSSPQQPAPSTTAAGGSHGHSHNGQPCHGH
jgi:uncharacterized membrane protein YgcG